MKICICIAVLALVGASAAMNVFRMDIPEEADSDHQNENTLFFEPPKNQVVKDSLTCPDGTKCPNGQTCCKDNTGVYACCPLPEAICCEDHVHCCPKGYTCATDKGKCSQGNSSVSLAVKEPSTPRGPKFSVLVSDETDNNSVPCPGGAVSCPNQYTCCEIQSGGYGCCPLPQAVCCADRVHCCPSGYRCDVAAGTCSKGDKVLAWFSKQTATPKQAITKHVSICPDKSTCQDGETCCAGEQNTYACCPLPDAVCCTDKFHCCPKGYTCDVGIAACTKENEVVAWYSKVSREPASEQENDVTCPDQSTCPSGQTCCENQQGKYACCPLPSAVCCSDKLHCCPEGYTCDVAAGRCNKGNEFLALSAKQPAKTALNVKTVTCTDQSTCPDGSTCCEDQQGGYACCPLPQAVCCSDKLHCCPRGYTCDVGSGTCSQGTDLLAWFTKEPSTPAPAVNDVTCPDQSKCPSGQTCCEDQQGGYACCPYPQAVCCSDKLHCCPEGYTCDVAGGRCNKGNEFLALLKKEPSRHVAPAPVNDVTCHDQSTCPSESTCCENQEGHYECCPLPEAVCCSDKIHCCPTGYTCDVAHSKCNMGNIVLTWFTKQPAKAAPVVNDVTCLDQSTCPSGQTCCENQQGGYACCPLPQAVCCSDKLHCCPEGYTCDVSVGRCNKGSEFLALVRKQPAMPAPAANEVSCPDQSTCPSGQTCCENQQGGYACCPLLQAVCCSDKLHCCPDGYTCDVSAGRCNKGSEALTLFTKQPATPARAVNDVTCPDQSTCPSGQTCCENQQGGYACCPLPQAMCCSDKLHCCPKGYTCDVAAGRCNKGSEFHALFRTQPATPAPAGSNPICPDKYFCPTRETCCENRQGGYNCCPFPNAVCCSDKYHCCPEGYTCDVEGNCNKSNDFLYLFKKQPAAPAPAGNDVTCPDQSRCPSGQTCCENQQGGYGCCPVPHAVCCSDKLHCCPEGYTCDVSGGTCTKGNDILSLLTKLPATPVPEVNDVTCPDQSRCPSGQTCCENEQGGYGCCPVPHAVCCSDKLHCCPEGYTCDVSAGTCSKGNDIFALFTKLRATPAPEVNDVTCPDQSRCPSGQTCCENQQGGYGCCPTPHAVCCSDKLHCCPEGYTCDVSGGTCTKDNDILSLLTKLPATPAPEVKDVTCPDQSRCPSGQTCCENQEGGYGCCPIPHAVCCSDKLHCCPEGYTCDVAEGRCNKGTEFLALFTKQPATPAPAVNDVTCPDQSTCPSGQTCCENQQGGYACCPLPTAVCCSDKLHCCPEGYTCDVSAGRCNKGNEFLALFSKQPSKSAPKVKSVTCPDGSECQSGMTCCESHEGGYGCCPLPKAVCCFDKVHCCPRGWECLPGLCTALDSKLKITWFTKLPAKKAPVVQSVTCPDQSTCSDGSTCCDVGQGKYGCCPTLNATCCPDHIHCCPSGFRCNMYGSNCGKGSSITPWLTKHAAKPASLHPRTQCQIPNAVCCSDKVHYCPQNTVCDLVNQKCTGSYNVEPLRKIGR